MTNTSQSDRIKAERKRLGLTQGEVAGLVGVTRETWGRYEVGKLKPGIEVLRAFANIGANADYLVTGKEINLVDAISSTNAYAKKLLESEGLAMVEGISEPGTSYGQRNFDLIAKFNRLDESGKAAVEAMINALLANKKG